MGAAIRDSGGALRALTGIGIRDGGGVLRGIKTGQVRDGGGALRAFYSSSSLIVAPPLVQAINASKGSTGADKTVSTAGQGGLIVTGGVPPITYAWTRFGGDTGIVIDNAAIAAPSWSKLMSPGQSANAVWSCLIQDAAGSQASAARDITLQLVENEPGGGYINEGPV